MLADRVLGAGLLSLVLVASPGWAQTPIPPQAPAPAATSAIAAPQPEVEENANPLANRPQVAAVLRFLQSQGVKLTTLGTEGGLAGYLGESPNSRMQVFYVTPDGSHVIAGLMFDSQGANVTGVQLGEMQRRFEAAQKQLTSTPSVPGAVPAADAAGADKKTADQATPAPVASTTTSTPATPPAKAAEPAQTPSSPLSPALQKLTAPSAASVSQPKPPVLPQPATPAEGSPVKADKSAAVTPPAKAAEAASAIAGPSTAADKYVSALDRGSVERALREVPWFQVGVKEAPAIYMVADPQCQFCHAAWQRLQPMIYDKKIQLRIIMIAGLKGSHPMAISILSRQNPGEAWLAGEGSVNNFTVAPPPAQDSQQYQSAQKYLDMNAGFVRTFGISSTPTFMYIGKDERLYSSIGLPEDADAFMAALK